MIEGKSTYIMVPKKCMYTWLVVTVIQLVLFGVSLQYTNLVFRRLCGVIQISDETYKKSPPTSPTGKILAQKFDNLYKDNCK